MHTPEAPPGQQISSALSDVGRCNARHASLGRMALGRPHSRASSCRMGRGCSTRTYFVPGSLEGLQAELLPGFEAHLYSQDGGLLLGAVGTSRPDSAVVLVQLHSTPVAHQIRPTSRCESRDLHQDCYVQQTKLLCTSLCAQCVREAHPPSWRWNIPLSALPTESVQLPAGAVMLPCAAELQTRGLGALG